MNNNLVQYYRERAAEYESIYTKPERQEDLASSAIVLQHLLAGKHVLEIACGTGYWTQRIAQTAASVHATDINGEVISIAKQKQYLNPVTFAVSDLFELQPDRKFDALFGGFIWSHVPVQELNKFVEKTRQLLPDGGVLVFMDNRYVEGNNHPITRTDEWGNTFQSRKLLNGSSHLVLKNFPEKEVFSQKLAGGREELLYSELRYFWIASCTV